MFNKNQLESLMKLIPADSTKVMVHCKECRIIFLEVSLTKYYKETDHLKTGNPDKWFVETAIHWLLSEGHHITMKIGDVMTTDISRIWQNKKDRGQLDTDIMLQKLYGFREEVKEKPI